MTTIRTAALALTLIAGCCSFAAAPGNETKTSNTWQNSFASNLEQLKGEWRGTCEVQWSKDDTTSTELDVTVKSNVNGGVLFAYDSFARGKAVNGVSNWSISNNQLTCNSYDARNDWQCTYSGSLSGNANEQSVNGNSNNTTYTQNIKFKNDGSCVVECFKKDGSTQQLVMRLTMSRMEEGKMSAASSYLDDAKMLAKINASGTTTASAGE